MEKWKQINSSNYSISNYWNVLNIKTNRLLKQDNNRWYKIVKLSILWKQKNYKVHRLVMDYFIWKSNLEINHIDLNKSNNNLTNLEYITRKDNMIHLFKSWKYYKKPVVMIDIRWNKYLFDSILKASKETWENINSISRICRWLSKKTKRWNIFTYFS